MKQGPHRYDDETWVVPNKESRANARRFLKTRPTIPKSKRGATSTGVARAKSIAAGELQPAKEISAWFARHWGYIAPAMRAKEKLEDSKALQASLAWGGLAMKKIADKAMGR